MTKYYLRDRESLVYRRGYWTDVPHQWPTREAAERNRAPHEEVVALTSNEARQLVAPEDFLCY